MNNPSYCGPAHFISEEALLDAVAVEKLKSNSRPHICMLLQPLAPGLAQFVTETSRNCDFTERITDDNPKQNTEELFNRYLTILTVSASAQQHFWAMCWILFLISYTQLLVYFRGKPKEVLDTHQKNPKQTEPEAEISADENTRWLTQENRGKKKSSFHKSVSNNIK